MNKKKILKTEVLQNESIFDKRIVAELSENTMMQIDGGTGCWTRFETTWTLK